MVALFCWWESTIWFCQVCWRVPHFGYLLSSNHWWKGFRCLFPYGVSITARGRPCIEIAPTLAMYWFWTLNSGRKLLFVVCWMRLYGTNSTCFPSAPGWSCAKRVTTSLAYFLGTRSTIAELAVVSSCSFRGYRWIGTAVALVLMALVISSVLHWRFVREGCNPTKNPLPLYPLWGGSFVKCTLWVCSVSGWIEGPFASIPLGS